MTTFADKLREHSESLQFFIKRQTSIGVSGDAEDLARVNSAIEFFANLDPDAVGKCASALRELMEWVEKQHPKVRYTFGRQARDTRVYLDENEDQGFRLLGNSHAALAKLEEKA